jgi:hypothetical protein
MGKFKPGQSGNPGGRPAGVKEVMDLARSYSTDAIEGLAAIAKDKEKPAQARVAAWNALLDRGYGKPAQSLEVTPGRPLDGLDDSELATTLEAIRAALASRDPKTVN